jgi:acyl transferase domain-containing protein
MTEPPTDYRALLLQALGAVEDLQAKLVAAERTQSEPIALVGIGCRFPGAADSAEAFWQLLERGENAVVEVPADRWDIERYYSPDRDAAGKMYSRHGGFLRGVDRFEPEFFGISPREARTLDPQQRLVLEVAWEALEHGGVPPTSLRESRTGVFVGIGGSDFSELQMRGGDLGEVDAYVGTGGGPCFAAGRLSYVLGLRGPSLAVDTACSSSLVAVHLACQSLRQRECDLALAGGVHVMLSPFVSVYLSRTQALSSDGRSKVFDAAADGFVRGEGCGMVVLKRLSDAVEARDPIIAVVRGSGLTQDGASSGLTVPNGPAQAAAVRAALQQARLEPAAIGYVEAHGTGTSLGDPIEMNALCSVLGEGRSPASPLVVGSVKSNIGHLEAAAGVAGFIKAALVVQRGVVPAQLHFTRWNPEIDFQGTTVVLPSKPYPWPADGSRYAGVSAFGLSGTNAHVVIGEAPVVPAVVRAAGVERSRFAMRVTARSAPALAELGGRLAAHLRTGATADLADACYTANVGRAHFGHRAVVVGDTLDSVREGLEALAGQREDARVVRGTVDRTEPTVAFLFPGQGAQYAGMGQSLYRTQAVFRDALDRCDALLREHLDMPLLRVLYPPAGEATPIDETRYTQPVLLAFEYALASLWQAWGVRPAALLGHSLGEYAAACVAGLLPLEHALRLVAVRGRLMGSLPPGGAMTAVFASEAQVREAMRGEQGALSIAAINGPENVVLSGARDAVQRVTDRLAAAGVEVRPLNVSHAYHSALLEPILDEFEQTVARAGFGRATVPIISNLTGQPLTEAQQRDPAYWRRHAREPVRYADGVRTLHARGIRYFVEMGPHTTACGMAAPCIPGSGAVLVPSLRKGRDDWEQLLESLSMLYVRGAAVDWESVDEGSARRRVHLPTYAFQRERHWPEEAHKSDRPPQADSSSHPVLTGKVELVDEPRSVVWEGVLDTARLPYLEDHRVQGVPVVPATMYMELALAAGRDGAAGTGIALRDVNFHRPLLVSSGSRASIQVKLVRDAHGSAAYRIHSRRGPGDGWMLHSTGIVDLEEPNPPVTPTDSLENVRRRCTVAVTGAEFYARMAERGNQWGPTFQGVSGLWQGESEALSLIEVPEAIAGQLERYYLHPALADASGQVLAATISLMSEGGARAGAFVGGGIDAVRLVRRPQGRRFWAHARIRPVTPGQDQSVLVGDVTLMDEAGETLCVTEGARFWYLDHKGDELAESQVGLYQTEWIPQPDKAAAPSVTLPPMLIFADDAGVGAALLEQLRANGGSGKLVTRGAEYAAIGERFHVRSGERDDYEKVLAALGDTDSPATVLFLWGLDSGAPRGSDIDPVPARCAERCRELLYLVQAAARRSSSIQLRVWVVTARAQPIDADGDSDPLPAAIWGLGRTIKAEHQELWGGMIDTDALAEPTIAAAQILRILLGPEASGEDQIAVRGAERFVPRLRRFEPPRRAPFACSPYGTYLVTGGLGGLGLEVARWLASRGAQHLVLLGRTPLPPRAAWTSLTPDSAAHERIQHVRELEARGLQVCYAAVDVGDDPQLSAFLESYGRLGWPSIRGVVHAAGLMQYQPLATQTEADMREIFQSKVSGGWNLHRAFATELDFFVLFSSAAAILPSPFVGSYAAANAFLDGLAHLRRANGQAALSINWGAWTEVGMGARFAIENPQDARDTDHAISPAEGIAAMERLITGGVSQATVLGSDWTRWRNKYPQLARSPFMHELMDGASSKAVSRGAEHQGLVLGLLRARTGEERSRAARSYLAECVGSVLGFAPHQLDVDQPISNLGFDSMMALELKSRIVRELQLVIPLVRLLDGPSVAQLAEVVVTALNARGSAEVGRTETADGAAVGVAPEAWDEGTI